MTSEPVDFESGGDGRERLFPIRQGRATEAVRRQMNWTLRQWYGRRDAAGELLKYLPDGEAAADVLARVAERALPPSLRFVAAAKELWPAIAGATAAKHSEPLFVRDGVLYVELGHPAFLAALSARGVKAALLEKLRELPGGENCTEVRYIPQGRRAGPGGEKR